MDDDVARESESTIARNMVIPFRKFVTTLAVDVTGRLALLAGQKALYVLDLAQPHTRAPGLTIFVLALFRFVCRGLLLLVRR